MPIYRVRVCEPTVYDIKARSRKEAVKKALKRYEKQTNTWLLSSETEVEVDGIRIPEVRNYAGDLVPQVYTGDLEEEKDPEDYLS